MNKEAINAFKRELENYSYYKMNLEGTLKLISYNEYLLENVHGIDPGKKPSGSSSGKAWVETNTYHRIINELDKLKKRRDLRIAQIEYIENILDQLETETKEICLKIYDEQRTYEEISKEYGYSRSSLYRRIDSKLSKTEVSK